MTELSLQHETQLRQSRLLDSQPNQKPNSSADFDTKFADFLAFASSSDLTQNGQDFQQEQNRYTEDYNDANHDIRREEFAVDYNQTEENAPYRAENYRNNDERDHDSDQSADDETSHQNRLENIDDDSDQHVDAQNRNNNDDNDNDSETATNATATNADDNQTDITNNNVAQNNSQNNAAPINNDLENLIQLVSNQPTNNVAINQASNVDNTINVSAQSQTVTAQTAILPQQLATNNSTQTASAQAVSSPTASQTAPLLPQAENGAIAGQKGQSNQAAALTASAEQANQNSQATVLTTEQVAQNGAISNINQPQTTNSQTTNNAQNNISVAQSANPQTVDSNIATDSAKVTAQKIETPVVRTQAKQPVQERTLLDELPVIAKSPLQSLIAETQTAQAETTQATNPSGNAQLAQPTGQQAPTINSSDNAQQQGNQLTGQVAGQQNANNAPANQTPSGQTPSGQPSSGQTSSGQTALNLPVEKITTTQINGQEGANSNAQVKNIQQPLRVNGGHLLQAQENSGSQLLQDLKAKDAQGQTSPQQGGAEKSVFDARVINQAQPIVTAKQPANLQPQAGDKPQIQTANNANNNLAQQSGQQQAFNGGDGNPQSQNQPQSQSQNQTVAQNNQQPNSTAQADNSSNPARFNQHLSESAQQIRKLHQQLSVKIQHAHRNDQTRINIQLRPAELGRVDVQIETLGNGKLQLIIAPEKADTLQLLQRDASVLQQSLQDAGLDVDQRDLSFLLRQDFAEGQKGKQSGGQNNRHANQGEEDAELPLQEQSLDEYVTITDDGRINARV
ncbi:MAG: flagellar hook-length control protein FliK [Alphaproteobacteria bacterium]|nr:flagellar hook-length control protein FliK [Alphaproteobacteria bacterium]